MLNPFNQPRSIGPCSQEFLWMMSEGFFSDHSRVAETWLFKCSDDTLKKFAELLDELGEEVEEWQIKDDDPGQDVLYTMILIEACKRGGEEFTFTDEEVNEWVMLYAITATLELEKRRGLIKLESEDVPMDKMRWGITEEGKNAVQRFL